MASSISSKLRPLVSTTARPTQATQAKQTVAKNRYTAGTPNVPTADKKSWPMAKLQTLQSIGGGGGRGNGWQVCASQPQGQMQACSAAGGWQAHQ